MLGCICFKTNLVGENTYILSEKHLECNTAELKEFAQSEYWEKFIQEADKMDIRITTKHFKVCVDNDYTFTSTEEIKQWENEICDCLTNQLQQFKTAKSVPDTVIYENKEDTRNRILKIKVEEKLGFVKKHRVEDIQSLEQKYNVEINICEDSIHVIIKGQRANVYLANKELQSILNSISKVELTLDNVTYKEWVRNEGGTKVNILEQRFKCCTNERLLLSSGIKQSEEYCCIWTIGLNRTVKVIHGDPSSDQFDVLVLPILQRVRGEPLEPPSFKKGRQV